MRTDDVNLPPYRSHKMVLYEEQGGVCAGPECGDTDLLPKLLDVDHILPQARGGTDHKENLQLLCKACNQDKGKLTQSEWRLKIAQRKKARKRR